MLGPQRWYKLNLPRMVPWFLRLFVWIPGSQFVCLGQILEAHIKSTDDYRGWQPAEFQEQFSFTVEFKILNSLLGLTRAVAKRFFFRI